jgi:ABC-type cobalamin/Fe3+-siderophores transport system ATPase subunit
MILETKNIEFSHNEERSFSYPDIQLESSGQLLILGKSGTGKTTLTAGLVYEP